MARKVEGYDVDDTLIEREYITRLGGSIKGRLKPYKLPNYTLGTLPVLDHTPQDLPGLKKVDLWFQEKRIAIPGVPEKLLEKAADGVQLLGITGRIATLEWSDMTRRQLTRERYPIKNVILTPPGIPTAVSKADAIRQYDVEEFTDDDLKTLYFLADLFPDRVFNYIRHRLTNIPVNIDDLARRQNIRVVPINQWMRLP